MLKLKSTAICMVIGILTTGCNSESDSSSPEQEDGPKIINVGTSTRTNTDTHSTKYSLTQQFIAEVSDPDGLEDIVLIEARGKTCDCKYVLHDIRTGTDPEVDGLYDDGTAYTANYYTTDHPDSVAVHSYELRVVDADGNEDTVSFKTSMLENSLSADAEFLYSPNYSGTDQTQGYPAFEPPSAITGTIMNNGYVDIQFDLNEDRAEKASIQFCGRDDQGEWEYFGSAVLEASGNLIVDGSNSVVLNWEVEAADDDHSGSFDTYRNAEDAGIRIIVYSKAFASEGPFQWEYPMRSITACEPLSVS